LVKTKIERVLSTLDFFTPYDDRGEINLSLEQSLRGWFPYGSGW
jgi:hypothetical protein